LLAAVTGAKLEKSKGVLGLECHQTLQTIRSSLFDMEDYCGRKVKGRLCVIENGDMRPADVSSFCQNFVEKARVS